MKTINKKVSVYVVEEYGRYMDGEIELNMLAENTFYYASFFETVLNPSMFFPVDSNNNPLECTEDNLEEFNRQLNNNVLFNVTDVKTYGDNIWHEIVLDNKERIELSNGCLFPSSEFREYPELKTVEDLFYCIGESTLTNAGEKVLGL